MKTIITGSRSILNKELILGIVKSSGFKITELVTGATSGPEPIVREWAKEIGLPIKEFVPYWGVTAADKRHFSDRHMTDYADAAIIIWDGKTKRTKSILDLMTKKKKKVYLTIIGKYNGTAEF